MNNSSLHCWTRKLHSVYPLLLSRPRPLSLALHHPWYSKKALPCPSICRHLYLSSGKNRRCSKNRSCSNRPWSSTMPFLFRLHPCLSSGKNRPSSNNSSQCGSMYLFLCRQTPQLLIPGEAWRRSPTKFFFSYISLSLKDSPLILPKLSF